MKLIVGLGNPGILYSNSRHNIGFSALKLLAHSTKTVLKKDKQAPALSAKARIGGEYIMLALPLTFMNLSGAAVNALVKKYKIDLNDLLVVCDDLDLEFGRLKIRPCGSSAGQRGIESIINSLGSKDFARLRMGIGRPRKSQEASDYVLSRFNRKEGAQLKNILNAACDCCRMWISQGIDKSMNIFNKKPACRQAGSS